MTFSEKLAEQIERVILEGIDNGSIHRETVKQIIVGPARHFGSLHLWFGDSWENYPECSPYESFAEIPCFEWLDRFDSVFPGKLRPHPAAPAKHYDFARRVSFLDAALDESYRNVLQGVACDVVEAIKWVIRRQRLGEFKSIVGFMAFGLSRSGHGDCVGFYHPEGAPDGLLPVFPIDEERTGGVLDKLDGFGWLTADGIRMFYPEVDDNEGAEPTRKYLFSDMLHWFKEDDERGLKFRLRTDSFDIELEAGYTLENWRWVTTEEVNDAIAAHFSKHPELKRVDSPPAARSDAELREWFAKNDPVGWFEELLKRGDAAEAQRVFRLLPEESTSRWRVCSDIVRHLAEHERHQETLELLDALAGKSAERFANERVLALLGLKRYAEVVEYCQSLMNRASDNEDLPIFVAMAHAYLGKADESEAWLNKVKKGDGNDGLKLLAQALIMDLRDDPAAIARFDRALTEYWKIKKFGNLFVPSSPRLKAALEQALAEDEQDTADGHTLATLGRGIRVEPKKLDSDDLLRRSYFSGTGPTVTRWQAVTKKYGVEELIGKCKITKFLRDPNGRIWGLAQTKGLVSIEVGADGTLTLGAPVPSGTSGSLEHGVIAGRWLFAAEYRNGLAVFELDGERAKHVVTAYGRTDRNSAVAVEGDVAALISGDRVEVFDVSTPATPRRVSTIGLGCGPFPNPQVADIVLKEGLLYACGRPFSLVIVDLKDPPHPRILSATRREQSPADGKSEHLHVLADGSVVVSDSSRGLWHLDVGDPLNPKSLAYFVNDGSDAYNDLDIIHLASAREGGFEYWAMSDSVSLVWRLLLKNGQPLEVLGVTPTANAEGEPNNYFYVRDFSVLGDDRCLAFGNHYFGVFKATPLKALKTSDVESIERSAPALSEWVKNSLASFRQTHPDLRAGVLGLAPTGDGQVSLFLAPAQTISAAEHELAPFEKDRELPSYDFSVEGVADPGKLDHAQQAARFNTLAAAYRQLTRGVLTKLPQTLDLSGSAAGRVYFLERSREAIAVVACQEVPQEPWSPLRPEVKGAQRLSLADKLEDYKSREAVQGQVRKDEELYAELVELAKNGNRSAMRMLWQNRDLHPDDVIALMLDALSDGQTRNAAASLLLDEKEVPKVRSRLMELWNSLPGELVENESDGQAEPSHDGFLAMRLAEGLGLRDEQRMVGLAEALMTKAELDYQRLDEISAVCDTLDTRLSELRPHLLAIVDRLDDRDNRLASICRQLFRAGHRELPAKLLKQSGPAKRGEEYSGMKIGIPALDQVAQHQDEEPRVERMYTGWMLAERIHRLLKEDRPVESVWPPGLDAEPFPASWGFVLNAALPYLVERNELDGLVELLGKRLEAKAEFLPDQRFLLGLHQFFTEAGKLEPMAKVGDMILKSPAYDERTKKGIVAKMAVSELARGWELLKAEKLAEAREVANRLLAMKREDGQIGFFDARLRWKETKRPQAAIDAAQAYLKDLAHDPAGRGRLNNLIGCALDELGRVAEALPYFEQAAKDHADEPMYLCNIAEANEKLGKIPEALRYAREALRRKAKSAVCERIVRQYAESGA